MSRSYAEMQKILMEEMRLYHYPVAVTFLFTDEDVAQFREQPHYVPVRPITFCQGELVARMQGKAMFFSPESINCGGALLSFGMKDFEELDFKVQMRFCKNREQAERFVLSKPRLLPNTLKGVGVGPLGDAVCTPTVVHFYCDNLQSYQLAVDWMAAKDKHPLRPTVCTSSAACGGSVVCYQSGEANITPACAGSYNSGKTERGEVNMFIPGQDIEAVIDRMLERKEINGGGCSATRPGDPFPGANICKNCTLIAVKREKNSDSQA